MYTPRHARPSCLPLRAAVTGGLTAVLLPIAMAAPALAQEVPAPAVPPVAATERAAAAEAAPAAAELAATSMRISAGRTARDGTSRIGVRLLSGAEQIPGQPVTVEVAGAAGWSPAATLTTDGEGLAVGHVAVPGDSTVRAVFAGGAAHAGSVSNEATVQARTATQMRISASETGHDGRSRIGVRLISGGHAVAGMPVAIEAQNGSGAWAYIGQATTDGEGLAVTHLPFGGDTRIRATFSGSPTAMEHTSPEAVVRYKTASLGQLAVQIAATQAGKPYRYGSTGPSSFDCSGFVTYVYKTRLGRNVPRTSAAQAAALPAVAPSAKQPGDLLFFRTRGRVSHVGIYAGGNKMWAAPTTGRSVNLQPIYSGNYSVGRVV